MLRERVTSAAILIPPLLIVLGLGQPWIAVLVVVVTGLAALETFQLLRAAGYPSLPALGSLVAMVLVVDAAVPQPPAAGAGLLLLAVGAILLAVLVFALLDPREGIATWMTTVFGAFYASLLAFVVRAGEVAPALPSAAPLVGLGPERGWILLLVLGVWSYDTGAFVAGSRFGGRRFLTHISPSKTYAGLVGGLVASTVFTSLGLALLGQHPIGAVILGPLVGLAAQAGDLAESMLKRAAGAKDSGTLIPGHGGILDRVDSFLFAAPALTLYVVAVVR